jgi:hypothetical protein
VEEGIEAGGHDGAGVHGEAGDGDVLCVELFLERFDMEDVGEFAEACWMGRAGRSAGRTSFGKGGRRGWRTVGVQVSVKGVAVVFIERLLSYEGLWRHSCVRHGGDLEMNINIYSCNASSWERTFTIRTSDPSSCAVVFNKGKRVSVSTKWPR